MPISASDHHYYSKQVKPGKRFSSKEENMQVAGEMVVGRRATRGLSKKAREDLLSSPEYPVFLEWAKKFKKKYKDTDERIERFKLWLSSKAYVAEINALEPGGATFGLTFFSDLTSHEQGQFHGRGLADDPYRGNRRTPEFYESKLGKEVYKEEAAFSSWEVQHKKKYRDRFEREERFAVYFQNKKTIETFREENPDTDLNYPDDSEMDQVFGRKYLISFLKGSAPCIDG